MKTKDMNIEQTKEAIELIKKQIAFNNELNKAVRKYWKDHGGDNAKRQFADFWAIPSPEMIGVFDSLDSSFMGKGMKMKYYDDLGRIFSGFYSIAVNTYHLNDLHGLEDHLKNLESASENKEERCEIGEDSFSVERDLEHNRLNISFDYIPDEAVRSSLKGCGFKWSRYLSAWTRQLTPEAERGLEMFKKSLTDAIQ